MQYYIHIVETETGEIANCIGPTSEHNAEKVERGVLVNLNHEAYYTDMVSEEEHREHGNEQS